MTFARIASLLSASCAALLADAAASPPLPITVDGPPVSIAGSVPGRETALAFPAHAKDRVVVTVSGLRMQPASGSALLVTVRDAGDRPVTSEPVRCFAAGTLGATDTCTAKIEIATPGRHTVELEPPFSAAAAFSVKVSSLRTASLAVGAPGIEFATTKPKESIDFEMDVAAGQALVVAVEGLKHTPDVDSNSVLGVFDRDGNRVAFCACRTKPIEGLTIPPGPCRTRVPVAPAAGRYRVSISGPVGATASGRLVAREASR
jgi:hypothetical protein